MGGQGFSDMHQEAVFARVNLGERGVQQPLQAQGARNEVHKIADEQVAFRNIRVGGEAGGMSKNLSWRAVIAKEIVHAFHQPHASSKWLEIVADAVVGNASLHGFELLARITGQIVEQFGIALDVFSHHAQHCAGLHKARNIGQHQGTAIPTSHHPQCKS
jgi:hypothetical protein